MILKATALASLFVLAISVGTAHAQGAGGVDAAAVAKELRNPTTPLASLTSIFEYRTFRARKAGCLQCKRATRRDAGR